MMAPSVRAEQTSAELNSIFMGGILAKRTPKPSVRLQLPNRRSLNYPDRKRAPSTARDNSAVNVATHDGGTSNSGSHPLRKPAGDLGSSFELMSGP